MREGDGALAAGASGDSSSNLEPRIFHLERGRAASVEAQGAAPLG